jgi:Ca2+-binding EF-hand superfamily protein
MWELATDEMDYQLRVEEMPRFMDMIGQRLDTALPEARAKIKDKMKEFDANKDGFINLNEFLTILNTKRELEVQAKHIELFDEEGMETADVKLK